MVREAGAFERVDPVFQAAIERVGAEHWLEADVLRRQPPAIRMLLSTRAVDGLVGNSGWIAVAVEGQRDLLPLAVEGYGLLGLEAHAAIARRAAVLPFDPDDDEAPGWSELDDEWFGLPDGDEARAAYIDAHPEAFRT
jgi:hypothetical protein